MIELLPPNQPPEPGPSDARGRRGAAVLAAAVVLALVVVVALVNGHRNRDSAARQAADRIQQLTPAPSTRPSPGPTGGQRERLPVVACPQIRDEESQLGYRCIDNALRQDGPDIYLGLRISLTQEVEPDWVISQGSGNPLSVIVPPSNDTVGYRQHRNVAGPALPTDQQVRDEVRRRSRLAVERGYGDNPASRTMAAHARSFSGVPGFELVTEITINPAYRAQRGLAVRVERLWTVGLPTSAGVSIFMLSIPDNRADLWAKAEATVATVHVL